MQPAKPAVYVLIRIPKSGSTSIREMIADALPGARHFEMPYSPDPGEGLPRIERLRATRSRVRRLARHFRSVTFPQAWRYVDRHARAGDIVSGHIRYGDPALPSLQLRYITLLREPLARVLSEYNYSRLSYQRGNVLQRGYRGGRLRAAGTRSFSGYLAYLDEITKGDANMMSAFACGRERPEDALAFMQARYFHYGVLEHLDHFATGLGRKLGTRLSLLRENVTPRREAQALSAADKPVFERLFARDIALYQAVLADVRATVTR